MSLYIERLADLRAAMKKQGISACIIPSADRHLGEYVPAHWKIVRWLTGFTGSAATVVVTDTTADLLTDSRYYIQAEKELAGSGFRFFRPRSSWPCDITAIVSGILGAGDIVAVDGHLVSVSRVRKLEKELGGKGINLDLKHDIAGELWSDRPPMPDSSAFEHPVEYCGKDRTQKIAEVRERMKGKNVEYHLLTSPDDIMWLLNIRGKDLEYTPVIFSFALVGEMQILLFVDERKIPLKLASVFDSEGIVMLPYEETEGMLATLPADSSILVDPETTSAGLFYSLSPGIRIVEDTGIPGQMKAVRNKTEISNIGRAMQKDGVALTKFFFWFEQNSGGNSIKEISVAQKLLELRSGQKDFISPSFPTIAAFNENAALPHYSPTSESDTVIKERGILLIDSGGQYLDGTTDITRTIAIGTPTREQKRDFTLVLKGMISLAMAKFPYGTRGYQLDILARKALWDNGLNYGHGTGHGVGFCLSVHEGPQSISPADNRTIIEPGMLISDEPAVYREGEYGIRTENLILCYEDEETEFGRFLKFDTLSLCYIDKNLVDKSLLSVSETEWLNDYHKEVYDKISPSLTSGEALWLKEKTESF